MSGRSRKSCQCFFCSLSTHGKRTNGIFRLKLFSVVIPSSCYRFFGYFWNRVRVVILCLDDIKPLRFEAWGDGDVLVTSFITIILKKKRMFNDLRCRESAQCFMCVRVCFFFKLKKRRRENLLQEESCKKPDQGLGAKVKESPIRVSKSTRTCIIDLQPRSP